MKAMILAAGLGTRMQHLTQHTPKPLLPVKNTTLIGHIIAGLAQAGVTEIVINLHYEKQQLVDYLQEGTPWGVTLQYSYEPQLLDTGGALKHALPLLGTQPFILVNSDFYTDFPYQNLKLPQASIAHLILTPSSQHDFALDQSQHITYHQPQFEFCGISVISPTILQQTTLQGSFSLFELLDPYIKNQQVSGEVYNGTWLNLGSLAGYQQFLQQQTGANNA